MDESTTLADLLSLNLHEFGDEVSNIVDKAVKEMSMEKVLKELDVTWEAMEFEHEKHPRTQITTLRASEELIETLEDNQVSFTICESPKAHFQCLPSYCLSLSTAKGIAMHCKIKSCGLVVFH